MTALLALVALAAARPATVASPAATDDAVFRALQDELARAKTLKMDGVEPPYYLGAYVNDAETFRVSASFGSLVSRGDDTRRTIEVQVRVGDMNLDNTNFANPESSFFFGAPGLGRGHSVAAEPDYDSIRHGLWLAFDDAYKQAVEEIARKRAYLETNDVKDRPPDFAKAPLSVVVLPRERLSVDRERWTRLVKKASAVFRAHRQSYAAAVGLTASVSYQYFVSSDGAKHRFGEPLFHLDFSAATAAADGMNLAASADFWGRTESELPREAEVLKAAKEVADRIDALAKAPTLSEDYTGPVLFTGRAAAQFFLETIGDPLSHPRQMLGAPVEGRLIDRLGKHIGPTLLTVRDDPTLHQWKNQPLLGYFPVDDDGVKPMPITLVDQGLLRTYYMSRIPTSLVKETNGHSRAGQGSVGNLFVETRSPQSKEALKKQLIRLARENDLDYGLMVEELGESRGSHGGTTGVALESPALLYRVFADGRQELVRGASFKPTTFRVIKDIVAMGSEATLLNTDHAGQRVSVIAPSVLVKELELKRPKEEFEKPPFSPRPELTD